MNSHEAKHIDYVERPQQHEDGARERFHSGAEDVQRQYGAEQGSQGPDTRHTRLHCSCTGTCIACVHVEMSALRLLLMPNRARGADTPQIEMSRCYYNTPFIVLCCAPQNQQIHNIMRSKV